MPHTPTAPAHDQSSRLLEHHCVSVVCTRCHESFDDEFTHHFESMPHALRVLGAADWAVTEQAVLCPNCTDDADSNAPATVAVALCEYCSPPLFSAKPPLTYCRCHDQAITHVLIPLNPPENPGFQHHSCVSIRCSDCDADLGDEESTPHYPSTDAAIASAKRAGWMVAESLMITCPRCTNLRGCNALGHSWPENPDFVSPAGLEYRYCQRDCGLYVTNLITDKDMPWL